MTKDELIAALVRCNEELDLEEAHKHADELLVEFIDDSEIAAAYTAIAPKWYA